ncbi:DUF6161 domain-containing protein [Aeromonas veronii]|uniref:DUF6161 domain-containing protein n=1 Tax=Aeromonas veronii TaxID=654 RepID=UPI003D23CB1E
MMSEQVVNSEISIPLGNERTDKIFSSIEQYRNFLESEIDFWRWLSVNAYSPQIDIYRIAKQLCIDHLFWDPNLEDLEAHIENLIEKSSTWLPIYSFTPEGQFIEDVRNNYGPVIASFALLSICDLKFDGFVNYYGSGSHYHNMLIAFSSQNAIAINLVLLFKNNVGVNSKNAHEESIKKRSEQFMVMLTSVETQLFQSVNEYNGKFDNVLQRQNELYEDTKNKYKRLTSRILRAISRVGEHAKEKLNDARKDVKQAATTYHEQVDLDASVSYWKTQKSSNSKRAFIWFICGIVGSIGLTFLLLVAYYTKGGIVGLSAQLAKVGTESLDNKVELSNNIENIVSVSAGMEHLVLNATGAALVVTLMAVMIRVALRQFNTYSHLSLEAAERVTMVKTYLALLNEGKLKSDQDRHLALEALFRTSQTGMIAETSFNSPVDIIVKSLADKAKV